MEKTIIFRAISIIAGSLLLLFGGFCFGSLYQTKYRTFEYDPGRSGRVEELAEFARRSLELEREVESRNRRVLQLYDSVVNANSRVAEGIAGAGSSAARLAIVLQRCLEEAERVENILDSILCDWSVDRSTHCEVK